MRPDAERDAAAQSRAFGPEAWVSRVARAARRVALVLVHSTAWISLGAGALAVATMRLAAVPVDPLPACLAAAATMVVYGVNRVTDLAVDEQNVPGRAAFVRRYGVPVVCVGAACYLVAAAWAVAAGARGAAALWVPPVVGVAYSRGVVQRRLLAKNVLVGLGWAGIPVGVGAYFGALDSPVVGVVAVVVALSLTGAAVVFDVKDVAGDRAAGVRTVPTEFGPAWARRVGVACAVAAAVFVAVVVALGVVDRRALVLLVYAGYVGGYSVFATPERTPLFYGFVADGEHVAVALAALAVT